MIWLWQQLKMWVVGIQSAGHYCIWKINKLKRNNSEDDELSRQHLLRKTTKRVKGRFVSGIIRSPAGNVHSLVSAFQRNFNPPRPSPASFIRISDHITHAVN